MTTFILNHLSKETCEMRRAVEAVKPTKAQQYASAVYRNRVEVLLLMAQVLEKNKCLQPFLEKLLNFPIINEIIPHIPTMICSVIVQM